MSAQNNINYIEIPAKDIGVAKAFFHQVFNWTFVDYGPDYASFNQGIDGGFYQCEQASSTTNGSVLVVLYSDDLLATEKKIAPAGGQIIKPIFDFPGGRRFHFTDPNGNEYAVWSTAT